MFQYEVNQMFDNFGNDVSPDTRGKAKLIIYEPIIFIDKEQN